MLQSRVSACISYKVPASLIWQPPSSVVRFTVQQNVVGAFILEMDSHGDFLFS